MVVEESVVLELSLETCQNLEACPRHTPPGAWTVLCLHAVDGCSSSALTDRTRLPLMHLAPEIGELELGLEVELLHLLAHPAALHIAQNYLGTLDHLLQAIVQTIHIRHLLREHIDYPIEPEGYHMEVDEHILALLDLDQVDRAPTGDCNPDEVGLFGVSSSSGRIHREHRPGERVLSTLSGSDSTLRLGTDCSILHMLAAKCECISDFSFMLSISVWSSCISARNVDC